jgi:hypothetical protein
MIRRERYWKVVQTGGLLLMNNDETLGIAQRLLKDSYFKYIEETEEEVSKFEELDILNLIFETDAYDEIKSLDSETDNGYVQTIVYDPKTGEFFEDFLDSGFLFVVDMPADNIHLSKQQYYEILIDETKKQLGEFLPEGFDIKEHFRVLTYPEFYEG